jgi:hypothetical protein
MICDRLEEPAPAAAILTLAFVLAFAGTLDARRAQAGAQSFTVPFHMVRSMILVEAQVNGRPATLLLDTGANNTIVSPQVAGLNAGQLKALQATRAGTGSEGDWIAARVDLRLGSQRWVHRSVLVMNLDDASKRMGTRIEGFLGQDILQQFKSFRIDYKACFIEITLLPRNGT